MRRILLLVIALIVYGSLYPWHFAPQRIAGNVFLIFLQSGKIHFDRFSLRDIAVNVALYVPLGAAAHLVLRRVRRMGVAWWAPVLLGAFLSASIEVAQLYVPGRDTNFVDFVSNTFGTAVGVGVAALVEMVAGPAAFRKSVILPGDRSAIFLLILWTGYWLFPFMPQVGLYTPIRKLHIFLIAPDFDLLAFVSAVAAWFSGGRLLKAAGARSPVMWLSCSLLVFPIQIMIVGRQPTLMGALGALAGTALAWLVQKSLRLTITEAGAFTALLLARGLSPFQFAGYHAFNWVPFIGFLNDDWQPGMIVLLQKLSYYGTAIWLLRAAGMRLRVATVLVAAVLGFIEVCQMRLPGRVPEIADPLLAILIGFGFEMLPARKRRKKMQTVTAGPTR